MKKLSFFIVVALSFFLISNVFADKSTSSDTNIVSAGSLDKELSFTSISSITCDGCSSCFTKDKGIGLPFKEFPFVLFALTVIIIVFFKRHRLKILFWTIGIICFIGLSFEASAKYIVPETKSLREIIGDTSQELSGEKNAESINEIESKSYGGEGISEDEFFSTEDKKLTDEAATDDEFEPIEQDDEFAPLDEGDEFSALPESENLVASESHTGVALKDWIRSSDGKAFQRAFFALMAVLLAAISFKYKTTRRFRTIFLLLSLLYFGFYSSGCPCMISSFQSLILLLLGEKVVWVSIIWIVGLLFLSYFFGRIWCGWVCHLGALQEFLYKPGKLKVTLSRSVQKIFRIVRAVAFIALILQLIYTRTNLFIKIDPFKVAFNLFSTNITGYVLLAVLIISSFFIYRPFCRSLCPVGLFLGWLSYIPGASALQIGAACKSCKKCMKQCDYQAISLELGSYQLKNDDCIRCGDCIDVCNFKAVHKNKSK
jgi:ferredoxin